MIGDGQVQHIQAVVRTLRMPFDCQLMLLRHLGTSTWRKMRPGDFVLAMACFEQLGHRQHRRPPFYWRTRAGKECKLTLEWVTDAIGPRMPGGSHFVAA